MRYYKMKKALNVITLILVVAALGLMGWAGCCIYHFSSDYAKVWSEEITAREVEQLETESHNVSARLAAGQQELAGARKQLAALADAEQAGTEDQIRACYEAREEAEFTARSLVATVLQKANYITLTPEQQESFGDILIDEVTGNAILAGSVKAALQAATEEKSLGDIFGDALKGAASGVQDYVQGKVQGAVSDAIGFDIFGVADFISEYRNAGDIPIPLINSMVTAQRSDVFKLSLFLEQEELSGADLRTMAGLMERISDREKEITAAGEYAGEGGLSGAEQLAWLAQVWEQNNFLLTKYAELGGDADEE